MFLKRLSTLGAPKRPAFRAVPLLATALLLAACSTTEVDKTEGWSTDRIYSEALEERDAGRIDQAVVLFEKLEGRAAGTPLAQQAQLDKAYTHYKAAEPARALATLERFLRLHPSSPATDYALYLKGLVSFNDNLGLLGSLANQDLSERDQNASKASFEAFRDLVARFPDSRYSPDARERMTYIVNSLAQYEVHVGRYYLRRGAYLASVARAQAALRDYPQSPAQEEALYLLVQSYEALGLKDLQADSLRVLQANFPNSEFLGGKGANSGPWWKLW